MEASSPRILELDQFLHGECSANAWAETAEDHARQLVDQLSAADWATLPSLISYRSEEWRERLYSAISDTPLEVLVPFLLQALPSDLELNAMEELRQALKTLPPSHQVWQVDSALYKALISNAATRSGYHARFVNEVLSRLTPRT